MAQIVLPDLLHPMEDLVVIQNRRSPPRCGGLLSSIGSIMIGDEINRWSHAVSEPTSMKVSSSAVLALSTTTAPSAALGSANAGIPGYSQIVRLCSTVDAWVVVGGAAPVAVSATAPAILLPANAVEYFQVPAGEKMAAILASGTGSLSIGVMG